MRTIPLLLVPLLACHPEQKLTPTETGEPVSSGVDNDGDGFPEEEDCDDQDLTTFPGAAEVCADQLVNDCDSSRDASLPECAPLGTLALADADARLIGPDGSAQAGFSLSSARDVNGDGNDDLLIGAPNAFDGGTSMAYVQFGPVSGTVSLALADVSFSAEFTDDEAGFSVAGLGDTNGDGFADLLIGDPNGSNGEDDAGTSFVFLGPVAGDTPLASADARLLGELTGHQAGFTVAAAGDVDGDDHADLVIGAPYKGAMDGSNAGGAYLLYGPVGGPVELGSADTMLLSEGAETYAGYAVAGAGDTDGDGRDDLLIGSNVTGLAWLTRGPMPEQVELADADARFEAESEGDLAGTAVSGAGDVNWDGHADLLIGATEQSAGGTSAGAAYLVLGPVTGTVNLGNAAANLVGAAAGDYAGTSVAAAGDVDGDQFGDVLVGAPAASPDGSEPTGAGSAFLVLGPITGAILLAEADGRYAGESTGDRAGHAVAGAGDVNADGYGDLMVGAYGDDSDGVDAGATYLLYGGGI